MPIAPQLPAILRRRIPVVAARRDHRHHPPTDQSISQGLAVIPAIGHQPRRSLAGASWRAGTPDGPRVQGRVLQRLDDITAPCITHGLGGPPRPTQQRLHPLGQWRHRSRQPPASCAGARLNAAARAARPWPAAGARPAQQRVPGAA
jgi:hypothetical protein